MEPVRDFSDYLLSISKDMRENLEHQFITVRKNRFKPDRLRDKCKTPELPGKFIFKKPEIKFINLDDVILST